MKLLPVVLGLALSIPALGPAGAAPASSTPTVAPRSSDVPCTDMPSDRRVLPSRLFVASGNGVRGHQVGGSMAWALGPDSYTREALTVPRTSLTRARLEGVERRRLRSSYFAGWRGQARKATARLLARGMACPDEAVVLFGYSQGAVVVRATLRNLERTAPGRTVLDHVAGVVLIGDPTADRREPITRFGRVRGDGLAQQARIPLPRILRERRLVSSVCVAADPVCSSTARTRRGEPTRASGRKIVRSHLGYDVGTGGEMDTTTPARRAAWAQITQLGRRLYSGPDFPRNSDPNGSNRFAMRVGDPFTRPAANNAGYRLVPAATTLPAGVQAADDLTLSGIAPDPDADVVTVGYSSRTVAPAVARTATFLLDTWRRQNARPGVSLVTQAIGGGAGNGESYQSDVSSDGRYVTFVSQASNLVADDTNGAGADVFVWDRESKVVERLDVGDASTAWPDVSTDGRHVAFTTKRQLAGDTDTLADAFVWDTQSGTVTLVSPGTAAPVSTVALDPDGSAAYFRDDPTGAAAYGNTVHRWDRASGTVSVVPPPAHRGWMVDKSSGRPWVASPDGRYVVTLGTGAAVWDRDLDAQHGASCPAPAATTTGDGAAIAADGSVFSFAFYETGDRDPRSWRRTCASGTTSQHGLMPRQYAFSSDGGLEITTADLPEARDRATGAATRPTDGTPTRAASSVPSPALGATTLSEDAEAVVFSSRIVNLIELAPDRYGQAQVYLWDRSISP